MSENKELPLVAVIDPQFVDEKYDPDIEREVLKGVARVECFQAEKPEDIPERVKDCVGLMAWHHITDYNREILSTFKSAKSMVRIGIGYDNIRVKEAAELGIKVSNIPDYGVEEVADSAICLLLNLMRKTHYLANGTRNGKWPTKQAEGSTRLNGKTIGLVGIGKIGMATALRAKAFSLNVIYYDPYVEFGRAKALGINQVLTLKELLEQSDIVSLHCPLTHNGVSNKHILNDETFQQFKKGAYLINTARGLCIDENALVKALKNGTIKGAGLDVFEKEPYLNGPLFEFDNVIMTPHSAYYSNEGMIEMRTKAAEEVKRVITGQKPWYCVNDKL